MRTIESIKVTTSEYWKTPITTEKEVKELKDSVNDIERALLSNSNDIGNSVGSASTYSGGVVFNLAGSFARRRLYFRLA